MQSKNNQHTHFSHHSETFLIVGASTTDKNGDLVFFERHLVVFDRSNDPLTETGVSSAGSWTSGWQH